MFDKKLVILLLVLLALGCSGQKGRGRGRGGRRRGKTMSKMPGMVFLTKESNDYYNNNKVT